MNVIQEINNVNDKFATQGSKLRIEKRGEKLNIRGSLPSKDDNNNGDKTHLNDIYYNTMFEQMDEIN